MRIRTDWTPDGPAFTFEPDSREPIQKASGKLVGTTARVLVPGLTQAQVHPDLEALAALVLVQPYTETMTMDRPVSEAYAAAALAAFGLGVEPVDLSLSPRLAPADGVPALAFSGGADSFAALTVMPPSTVPVFLRRVSPPGVTISGLYRDDAALYACEQLRSRHGKLVHTVESDMEHMRLPVGFPTDWANAVGIILLADRLGFDSVSWGLIAESAYRIGHEAYLDWAERRVWWARVFEATGLHFNGPVAGVSEVGTATICAASPYRDLVQSCARGTVGAPCGSCWKCFRKSTLDAALGGTWPDDAELTRMLGTRDVRGKLSHIPIPHENVVAYTVARYPGQNAGMRLLRRRTAADEMDLSWLEHWYSPSANLMADRHRATIVDGLDSLLGRMSPAEEVQMRAWDLGPRMADPGTADLTAELSRPPAGTSRTPAGKNRPPAGTSRIPAGTGRPRPPAWRRALRRIRKLARKATGIGSR